MSKGSKARLELWFVRESNAVLDSTTFTFQDRVVKTDRRRDREPVQWRSGVQAHMVVLIRWAISARLRQRRPAAGAPNIPAEPGTPAYCVYHSLTKSLKWRDRLFGDLPITSLIRTKQQNRKPFLHLHEEVLTGADIKVFVEQAPVEDPDELKQLVDDIEKQWHASHRPRHGAGPHVGPMRPVPPDPFGTLTPAERQDLVALAAASLHLPAERLPPWAGVVIGHARRVQLASEFRALVGRAVFFLDKLAWEIEKEPKEPDNLSQTQRNVTEFLGGFTESTRIAYDQASHWPAFREVIAAIKLALQDFGRAARKALGVGQTTPIPAALEKTQEIAANTRKALAEQENKLNGLHLKAIDELESIIRAMEPRIS